MARRRQPKSLTLVITIVVVVLVVIAAGAAATIALVIPARTETAEQPGGEDVSAPEEPLNEPVPAEDALTIAEEAAKVAEGLRTSDEPWFKYVTGVQVVTWLRRPLIVVSTTIGPEQAAAAEELSNGIVRSTKVHTAPDGGEYTYFIRFLSSEGDAIGSIGSTDARWKLPDAPTPPANDAGLVAWLEGVYGPGSPEPEPWYGRIIGIASEADDPDGYVVVRTDLDPSDPADASVAETIIGAINSSGAAYAPGVRVLFGDGVYEWSGMLDGRDPYGG